MEPEEQALIHVAELMALSARTAPKARGEDFLDIMVLTGPELQKLGKAMLKFGERVNDMDYERDGMCVCNSTACLLVSVRDPIKKKGTPKGKEGRKGSSKGDFYDESERVKRYLDLGIALGSAAKTASIHNADCRIMWHAGEVAGALGMMDGMVIIGIPIAAHGKNIFFDRDS